MYTADERERLRAELLEIARHDERISGGAITGSAARDALDAWSDIDLAFGVRDPATLDEVIAHFTGLMYERYGALHHVDIPARTWVYRVFLLPSTLQVDLGFVPAADFGARAATFRLVFGATGAAEPIAIPSVPRIVAWAWLYALHVRSAVPRGKLWQAEYMLHSMRDQVLALACVRHGLVVDRAQDSLPVEVLRPLGEGFVARLAPEELARAFVVVTEALIREVAIADGSLARRLAPPLREMADQLTRVAPAPGG